MQGRHHLFFVPFGSLQREHFGKIWPVYLRVMVNENPSPAPVSKAIEPSSTAAPKPADPRISTTTGIERKAEDTPQVTVPPAPPTDKKLALADGLTVVAKAEKDGKIRITCSSMMDAAMVVPGQVLELRWVEGKVRLAIRAEARP